MGKFDLAKRRRGDTGKEGRGAKERPSAAALLKKEAKTPAPLIKKGKARKSIIGLNFNDREYEAIKNRMIEDGELQLGRYLRKKLFSGGAPKGGVDPSGENEGGRFNRIAIALTSSEYDHIKKIMIEDGWTLKISVYTRELLYRAMPEIR